MVTIERIARDTTLAMEAMMQFWQCNLPEEEGVVYQFGQEQDNIFFLRVLVELSTGREDSYKWKFQFVNADNCIFCPNTPAAHRTDSVAIANIIASRVQAVLKNRNTWALATAGYGQAGIIDVFPLIHLLEPLMVLEVEARDIAVRKLAEGRYQLVHQFPGLPSLIWTFEFRPNGSVFATNHQEKSWETTPNKAGSAFLTAIYRRLPKSS